jgi:hypothetical protein
MTPEILLAAQAAVQRGNGPMTISRIRTEVARVIKTRIKTASETPVKMPSATLFAQQLKEAFAGPPEQLGVYSWPKHGSSWIYCNRSLRTCIEEALLRALDREPLTAPKAAKAVRKALKYISETLALAEVKAAARELVASQQIVPVAPNRQCVMYLSRNWMAGQAVPPSAAVPASGTVSPSGNGSVSSLIPAIVERLQPGPGNYVRVGLLRNAPEIRGLVDSAVIQLADAGKLVLARYDGPRPVPDPDKWIYVEDERGDLFIGVALPRIEEVEA